MSMNAPPCVARLMPTGAPSAAGFDAIQTFVRIAGQRDAGNKGFYPALVSARGDGANQQIAEEEVEDFREDLGPFVVAAETTRMAPEYQSRCPRR
jgi:hypothetical protein